MSSRSSSVPRWQIILAELAPVFLVIAVAAFVLSRMEARGWTELLLYNGDSLVLPLIDQSLREGEGLQWVFSSQLFVFPELLIYEALHLVTQDPRVALVANAILMFVLLYATARVVARFALQRSRHRYFEIATGLVVTAIFAAFCVFEPAPQINGSSIATLFLFTTYYPGVILVGLAVIVLTLWVGRGFTDTVWGRKRVVIYVIVTGLMTVVVTLCNPLYAMQVVAPLCVSIVTVWLANKLRPSHALLLLAVNAGGAAIGLWSRRFVEVFLSADVDSYINDSAIPEAIMLLQSTIGELTATSAGKLKLALLVFVFATVIALFLYAFFTQVRPHLRERVTTTEFLLTAFATFSALSLLVGFIYTGSATTRYLIPLFVFPLIAFGTVITHVLRRTSVLVSHDRRSRTATQTMITVAGALAVGVVVVGAASAPAVARMASGENFIGTTCFDEFTSDDDVNGVGSFWITRQWEVYGAHQGDILQVEGDLRINPWMINLDSYDDKDFSFVVVERTDPNALIGIEPLGEASQVIRCGDRTIYDFAGTPGETILTDRISESLATIRAERGLADG